MSRDQTTQLCFTGWKMSQSHPKIRVQCFGTSASNRFNFVPHETCELIRCIDSCLATKETFSEGISSPSTQLCWLRQSEYKSADPSAWPEGEAQGKREASIRCSSDSTASLASLCIFLACLGQPVMFLACLRGASHSGCAMLSMAVSTALFRQLNPQCCSGPLYFNPSTHYVNPSTHPRPKLPPPPTHPSLCF